MRLNRRMERYLADLRSREVDADSILPGLWPDVRIIEAGGCYVLQKYARRPHLSPADFPDPTNLECSANRIRIEGLLDRSLAESAPLLLLTTGMMVARAISRELARFNARFNVIISYDGEGCAVRFHKIRAGERWLHDDLEGYSDEGVLVVEAGAAAPVSLLGE